MSININIYRKMGPFVVVTVLSIMIFLFMLAPLYSIDLNGRKTSISIYDQITSMTSAHIDEFGHIQNENYTQLQYSQDRIDEIDKLVDGITNDYDRSVLLTEKAFLKNEIMTYKASASLVAFNTLMFFCAFIGLLLFFVRRQRDRIIRFKFFAYVWLLVSFIISCILVGSINAFVHSIKLYGFMQFVGISQVAAIVVLCFTLIIGAALFFFEISEIMRYRKNHALKYVYYDERTMDFADNETDEDVAIEPSNIE